MRAAGLCVCFSVTALLAVLEFKRNSGFEQGGRGQNTPSVAPQPSRTAAPHRVAGTTTSPPKLTAGMKSKVAETYGKLPLTFEANHGQTDSQVRFVSRGRGYAMFLTATEAVLVRGGSSVRMKFDGANPAPRITGVDPLAGKRSYFIGRDPRKWRTAIPTYGKVRYENLYPGVDLVFRGSQGRLEYDFLIAPGADPGAIRLSFEGAQALGVNEKGDVLVHTGSGTIVHQRPVVWQEVERAKKELAGRFVVSGNELAFEVSGRDPEAPLVIDPAIVYSTYLGGSEEDRAYAVAVDSEGNAYVTGVSDSVDFPTTQGALQTTNGGTAPGCRYDAFVTKIDPTGTALVYSTYLGGDCSDTAYDIAVDSEGSAYVTGDAGSDNFPTTPGAFRTSPNPFFGDTFVTKLNATGTALVYSTYLGADDALGMAVDSGGNAYITGIASPPFFPTTPGAFQTAFGGGDWDAFVTKLNPSGTALVYSTYLGGIRDDVGTGIAVDSLGNGYVTGVTKSPDLRTTSGAFQTALRGSQDAFVGKLNPSGSDAIFLSYLGGSGVEAGLGSGSNEPSIAVDSAGSAYVAGTTSSTDFPTTQGAFQRASAGWQDVFVTKLNASGTGLAYSTYVGGEATDGAKGIAVDSGGNAYVTGSAGGAFPTTAGALRTCPWTDPARPGVSHGCDAFLTKLNGTGSALVYSTGLLLGPADIAADRAGNAYLTGSTRSMDVTPGAFQTVFGGGMADGFVAKFELPAVASQPPSISAGGVGDAATFGARLAAGGVAALFGSNLASSTIVAGTVPLPTTLGDVTVRLNGIPAPLFFVSASQINFLVPWELKGQARVSLTVTAGGATSTEQTVNLATFAPAIFSMNQQGTGQGAILIAATGEIAAPTGGIPGRATRPARRGEYVSIFCTGLGAVTNQPTSGGPGPSSPLSATTTTPSVTIGGASATVSFSGLAPGFVGLYQVNSQVPASAPTGNAVPVVVSIGGVTSNTVTMAVAGDGAGAPTAPRPIAPVDNAAIRQNDPASGCALDPSRGAGFRIRFEWSAPSSSEQVSGYALWAGRRAAATPMLDLEVPPQPAFSLQRCGMFIPDDSSEAWEWRVRARDGSGNFGPWSSSATFRFLPCRLADGQPCSPALPATGLFASTSPANLPRAGHTATLLADGRVLIVGGDPPRQTAQAELWDPQTGRFTLTGSLRTGRAYHRAILLGDGRVLISGGRSADDVSLASAEAYLPGTGQFTPVGSMTEARVIHSAVRLADGRVLITGGSSGAQEQDTAELFIPATGAFMPTGPMTAKRSWHTATLLPSGKVLVVGGSGNWQAPAELYDPAKGIFTPTARTAVHHSEHTATALPNGQVLIAGGLAVLYTGALELYDPATNVFFPAGTLAVPRGQHQAVLLLDGSVLVTGGVAPDPVNFVERLFPGTRQAVSTAPMRSARAGHTATLLADGRVLIVGGIYLDSRGYAQTHNTAELFTPGP